MPGQSIITVYSRLNLFLTDGAATTIGRAELAAIKEKIENLLELDSIEGGYVNTLTGSWFRPTMEWKSGG